MELLRFTREEDALRAAREVLCLSASRAVAEGGTFSLALSGGSSPAPLYRLLAEEGLGVDWRQVRLFQVDERLVPPDDPASNAAMIRNTLLGADETEDLEFHAMPTMLPGPEAAAQYDRLLHDLLRRQDGLPCFDCAVMGMGPDGHTASLFPGEQDRSAHMAGSMAPETPLPTTLSHRPVPMVRHVPRPGMPPLVPRLTLAPEMLARTQTLLFHVRTTGKEAALERVLRGDPELPAAQIRGRVRTVWVLHET